MRIEAWLEYFNNACKISNKDNDWKMLNISKYLKGSALTHYVNSCLNISHFDDLCNILIENFLKPNIVNLSDFSQHQLRNNLDEYFHQKLNCGRQLGLSPQLILEGLTDGMPTNIKQLMTINPPTSPTEWLKVATRLMKTQAAKPESRRYDCYRSNKVRTFMYLWSLSKLVLVFSYLSDLLASLMIPIKESPLKNVQELNDAVVAGKYKFGTLNGSYLLNYLMEFKSGIIKDLANHIRHHPENVLRNFSEVATRIEEEKFAVMIPHLYFVYSASTIGIEKFYTAKDSLGYGMVSIAFRKGFPLMEKVNWIIHRITECALYSKIVDGNIFHSQLKAPPPKPMEDKRALSFDDITPIFQVKKDNDGSLYGFGGSDFHLLQMLSKHVPFSYELMIRTDYAFGSIDKNGEWTGMIGMLKRNEADLAIGWLSNTYERQTVVDFSFPYLIDANVFVTAAPKILQRDYPFINPFQPLVWIYLLISLVLSGFALSILSTPIGGNKNRKENFFGRWFKGIRRILALLVGQGRYDYYRSTKVRAFMYLWSLSKLVLVFSYLSDVLASLMIPIKESPLKNVQELRDAVVSGKYQIGVFAGTSLLNNLMEAKSGIIQDLANHIRHHPENILKNFAESIKRVEEGKFALMNMRLHFMYSASQIGIERFYVAKDSIGYNVVSIAFRRGFRHMERVNRM
ncbi:probable glutamate receptor [Trichonephila clavata]|uniref:Probable glutamate receptor n=1 Tax=Trichonephila clavata TaxID=2740835 RepID=A0A8X6L950_TRICU|nr:probable glutamate receptor [Trichonephila clavata]